MNQSWALADLKVQTTFGLPYLMLAYEWASQAQCHLPLLLWMLSGVQNPAKGGFGLYLN